MTTRFSSGRRRLNDAAALLGNWRAKRAQVASRTPGGNELPAAEVRRTRVASAAINPPGGEERAGLT